MQFFLAHSHQWRQCCWDEACRSRVFLPIAIKARQRHLGSSKLRMPCMLCIAWGALACLLSVQKQFFECAESRAVCGWKQLQYPHGCIAPPRVFVTWRVHRARAAQIGRRGTARRGTLIVFLSEESLTAIENESKRAKIMRRQRWCVLRVATPPPPKSRCTGFDAAPPVAAAVFFGVEQGLGR